MQKDGRSPPTATGARGQACAAPGRISGSPRRGGVLGGLEAAGGGVLRRQLVSDRRGEQERPDPVQVEVQRAASCRSDSPWCNNGDKGDEEPAARAPPRGRFSFLLTDGNGEFEQLLSISKSFGGRRLFQETKLSKVSPGFKP